MSAQFGKCNFDGKPVDPEEIDRVRPFLTPYGPDGEGVFRKDNFGIIHRAFHTTTESRLETQPCVSPSGAVITWDGRLDNRREVIHKLGGKLSVDSSDLSIVAAAYAHWGSDFFARLIGDWALSLWNPAERSLILAKDPIGTRHLYYTVDKSTVTWSTILDALLPLSSSPVKLNEEYIAGWLAFFPAAHLTPYVGVHAVPPASYVLIRNLNVSIAPYWRFDPDKQIRYRTDHEYEEHFRIVFSESIRRRLRSFAPVLAELSGGLDSSSIVCVADTVIARGQAETPRLDTVSYYDDGEPNWDELPYVTKVEAKRGRTGCHIDVHDHTSLRLEYDRDQFSSMPGWRSPGEESDKQFTACLIAQENRVVLSGVGGDEVLGGVPTPMPELANLLASIRLVSLGRQLPVWALAKRKPLLHLMGETIGAFLPDVIFGPRADRKPAPWFEPDFAKRQWKALRGYRRCFSLFGSSPSFQDNLSTLGFLRRQFACSALSCDPPYEKRYPYLDRDLLEFIYAVPRDQVVRPNQRRSLMRRALARIVPEELLTRKRKAFVVRGAMVTLAMEWSRLIEMTKHMTIGSLGIVNSNVLIEILQRARRGEDVPLVSIMRTLHMEYWLRHLERSILPASLALERGNYSQYP